MIKDNHPTLGFPLRWIQNGANGNQLRAAFQALNTRMGSEVVTNIRNIMNNRLRHPYRASGRQIRTAFEEINTYLGTNAINLHKIQNIADGRQIVAAIVLVNEILDRYEDLFVNITSAATNPVNNEIRVQFSGDVKLIPPPGDFVLLEDAVPVTIIAVNQTSDNTFLYLSVVRKLNPAAVLTLSYTATSKSNINNFVDYAVTNNGL